jgi:anti-sigma28 factor (negative regulator of flagellin synthesis)
VVLRGVVRRLHSARWKRAGVTNQVDGPSLDTDVEADGQSCGVLAWRRRVFWRVENDGMADIASIPSAIVHGAMTGRLSGASAPVMREAAAAAYRAQRQESRSGDQVQISPSARYLAMMKGMPEIREDLVEDARARIAAGEMDTPERLNRALDEMIGDFEGR